MSHVNRAVAERKKLESDVLQYQADIVDLRQELKIVDERVNFN